uniref:IS6 family transposase n=1 Tax=Heterorhabditis bacteriophora TaxID=37862 RepID=A0A1I7WVW8_HETBA
MSRYKSYRPEKLRFDAILHLCR